MSQSESASAENAAGITHARAGRFAEAVTHFERAIALEPDDDSLRSNLAAALLEAGRHQEALAAIESVIGRRDDLADAHHNRAVILRHLGRYGEAVAAARRSLELDDRNPDTLLNLAITFSAMGQLPEAADAVARSLVLRPRSALAQLTRGIISRRRGEFGSAMESFRQAIALDPNYGEAYAEVGALLRQVERSDDALRCFERAAALPGATAATFVQLGDSLAARRRRREAVAAYDRALALEPSFDFARAQRLHALGWLADWPAMEADGAAIASLGTGDRPVSPFALLALDDSATRQRRRAEVYCAHFMPAAPSTDDGVASRTPNSGSTARLRVGYFSGDFQEHAVGYLTARLFELHDRDRLEVHAFNYGPATDSPMRHRLVAAFDHFHEITALSNEQATEMARSVELDVAIDLKGLTEGSRLALFASRIAPVQVSFLGYPGTTGAAFVDYLVVDPQVVPPDLRDGFSERLIVMPDCYQPNDDRRAVAAVPTRAEAGLPEQGFVFASFNNSFKIGPDEFDAWAALLRGVAGSVLWLLAAGAEAEGNLRSAMANRGVAPERLLFAPLIDQDRHLARLTLADLVLDTFTYGAHTTASDALWAGVPVVTCLGRSFASRVAGSILHAAGLPELVTADRAAYVSLALDLALDPGKLATVRAAVAANRATATLFDSARFTRNLEQGLIEAHRRAAAGELPADIVVADLG